MTYVEVEATSTGAAMDEAKRLVTAMEPEVRHIEPTTPRASLQCQRRHVEEIGAALPL